MQCQRRQRLWRRERRRATSLRQQMRRQQQRGQHLRAVRERWRRQPPPEDSSVTVPFIHNASKQGTLQARKLHEWLAKKGKGTWGGVGGAPPLLAASTSKRPSKARK